MKTFREIISKIISENPANPPSGFFSLFAKSDGHYEKNSSGIVRRLNNIVVYPVTIADCENTTNEIDIIKASISANTWLTGEIIELEWVSANLQNSGGAINLTTKVYYGSDLLFNAVQSIADSANTGKSRRGLIFIRIGDDLYMELRSMQDQALALNTGRYITGSFDIDAFTGAYGGYKAAPGFGTTKDLKASLTWTVADAAAKVEILTGLCRKWRLAA